MVTFTQEHMDAITEMANLRMFEENGWKLAAVRTIGEEIGWRSKVFTIAREFGGDSEAIQMYANGTVKVSGVRNGMEYIDGTILSAEKLAVLSNIARRISDITYSLIEEENESN